MKNICLLIRGRVKNHAGTSSLPPASQGQVPGFRTLCAKGRDEGEAPLLKNHSSAKHQMRSEGLWRSIRDKEISSIVSHGPMSWEV